jgi:hypothetical protein
MAQLQEIRELRQRAESDAADEKAAVRARVMLMSAGFSLSRRV